MFETMTAVDNPRLSTFYPILLHHILYPAVYYLCYGSLFLDPCFQLFAFSFCLTSNMFFDTVLSPGEFSLQCFLLPSRKLYDAFTITEFVNFLLCLVLLKTAFRKVKLFLKHIQLPKRCVFFRKRDEDKINQRSNSIR